MRVAGGEVKGRKIKGTIGPGARPTTERARAAIFNILGSGMVEGPRVLDLYAGSGSLGIEALSRGATWADFVERSHGQCRVLQANLETTGFTQKARVHCKDVTQSLAHLDGSYDLVLMDPPYRLQEVGPVLESLVFVAGLLADKGIVVVGHSRHLALAPRYDSLSLFSHRRYGDNVIDFFEKETGQKRSAAQADSKAETG